MHLVPRWADRNLSRLELVAAWIIILLLIGTFARHMLVVFARAEQSMVERTVMNIETALKYKAGMARMKGEYNIISELANNNPVEQLQSLVTEPPASVDEIGLRRFLPMLSSIATPGNYGGEIETADPDTVQTGFWYYNNTDRTLVYIVSNREFFVSEVEGIPRLRYRINVDYIDKNNNADYDPGIDVFRSIDLVNIDASKWLI
jgi:general secretion pathway protein G